jgi:hypothetical protein
VSEADERRLRSLLSRLEELRTKLDEASADPDQALSLLGEVNALALEATQELDRARQSARDAQEDEE